MGQVESIICHGDQVEIMAKRNGRYIKIASERILFCKAEGNYTKIYLKNFAPVVLCKGLSYYESLLKKQQSFLRCHKTYLINIREIECFSSKKRTIQIVDHIIPISRRKSIDLFRVFIDKGIRDERILL